MLGGRNARQLEAQKADREAKLEEQKAERAWGQELAKEFRLQVAEVDRHLNAVIHSMQWLCWPAAHDPAAHWPEKFLQYHGEAHESLPKVMAAMSLLRAMNEEGHDQLQPTLLKVYSFDEAIAKASIKFRSDPSGAIEDLNRLQRILMEVNGGLPDKIAEVMSSFPAGSRNT